MATPWLYAWLLFTLMAIELPLAVRLASSLRLYRPAEGAGQPTWGQALIIGTFFWAGYFLVLWALSLAPLAVVAPVREIAIVAVAVWGVWRLRERERAAMKVSGAVATLVGVALLAV
jgi:drug/metabolite transporter (DMT)-like permease